jgi:hypothetical protein
MYRMLAGRTLFTGSSAEEIVRKAVREEPQPLREAAPEVPEKVAALVHRLLKKDPNERYASAKELRAELEKFTRHPGRTKALIAASAVAIAAIVTAIVFALKTPETKIIERESGDVLQARRNEYNAKSEADKRKIELDAVRGYLAIFEAPHERAELRASIENWLKANDYLDLAEESRARDHLRDIDETVAREAEEARRAEEARSAALAATRAAVEEPLGRGELLAALLAASAIDPSKQADATTRAELEKERDRLLADVRAKLKADHDRRLQEIDAAVAEERFGDAASLSAAAEKAWLLEGEPPDAVREEIATVRAEFATRRGELEQKATAAQEAVVTRDAARRGQALAAPTREAILALDFAGAADAIEGVVKTIETETARAELEPIVATLRSGDQLVSQVFAALENGGVPADPTFRIPGSDKVGELTGFDREKRMLKVTIKVPRGTQLSSVPLTDVATASGLRQLVLGRVPLSAEQSLALADLMTMVEVVRWAESLAPLAERAARYDPKVGWTDELRQGLPASAEAQLADEIGRVLNEMPAAQLDAVAKRRNRAISEEQCHAALLAALDPFLRKDSTIGWAASCEALNRLLDERKETLLLRMVRPWITGT